jgi:hypothetical protein
MFFSWRPLFKPIVPAALATDDAHGGMAFRSELKIPQPIAGWRSGEVGGRRALLSVRKFGCGMVYQTSVM